MVMVNRILNIVIFIAAIVSLLYAFLLFDRRTELRERGEKLADTMADVVKDLDLNSNTAYQKEINRDQFTTADGESKPGGKLGWAFFHEAFDPTTKTFPKFDSLMQDVKKQSADIREQRDILANSIAEHANLFNQPGTEATAYQGIDTYDDAKKALFENLEKVRKRDEAIASKIEETAKKIGHPVNKETLMDTENYDEPLISFGFQVNKLKEQAVNYGDTLAQAVAKIDAHEFEANVEMIRDENAYVAELTAILNDFANINENLRDYEKYKVEFLETKDTLERTIEALESANENLATMENKLANLEADYANLNQKYQKMIGSTAKAQTSALKKLAGKVIDVNYDWNYVVINLGTKDNLPEELEMIVAREQEYICKVLITKVYREYAVAEILPKFKKGNVIEGDRVIF